eukprot:754423-Hanusia_phi.AAC.1
MTKQENCSMRAGNGRRLLQDVNKTKRCERKGRIETDQPLCAGMAEWGWEEEEEEEEERGRGKTCSMETTCTSPVHKHKRRRRERGGGEGGELATGVYLGRAAWRMRLCKAGAAASTYFLGRKGVGVGLLLEGGCRGGVPDHAHPAKDEPLREVDAALLPAGGAMLRHLGCGSWPDE